ncbi:hypothetical protein QAD02_017290 [Eretmocerus hayati]|uniref:Uncharacterized protein n=1 Tax=Eretmocerus hayati TaxID=131215 RepID=A0ACC2PEG9_9HYME|nr:hypothetical protein QAD02_017290 [Eretmocerus hayati]
MIYQNRIVSKEHGVVKTRKHSSGNSWTLLDQYDEDVQLDRHQRHDKERPCNGTEEASHIPVSHPAILENSSPTPIPLVIISQSNEGTIPDFAKIEAARKILVKYRIFRQNRMKNQAVEQSMAMAMIQKAIQRFPIDVKKKTEALFKSKEKFIQKVMSEMDIANAAERRIQADFLVTRCIHVRNHSILRLRRTFKTLQSKWELAVTKLGEVSFRQSTVCDFCVVWKISSSLHKQPLFPRDS